LTRKRDGYRCQHCGKTQKQNGRSLDVHHIRPFRLFDNYTDANELDNLISLCMSCHGKAEHGVITIQPKLI
jgi:5-methylcytosine-specific restriction endonuclease McrA